MSDATRDALQQAADANGRSLSEEIERRVEFTIGIKEKVVACASVLDQITTLHVDHLRGSVGSSELLGFCTLITSAFLKADEDIKADLGGGSTWISTAEAKATMAERMDKAMREALFFQSKLLESKINFADNPIMGKMVVASDLIGSFFEDL